MAVRLSLACLSISEVALSNGFSRIRALAHWFFCHRLIDSLSRFLILGSVSAGKRAFIAGVADDQGFGWAIAKALSAAGAEILVGTWVPVCALTHQSRVFAPS